MSDLLTPHDIQTYLLSKSAELDVACHEYQGQLRRYPEANRQKRLAYNAALLTAEGRNAETRKAKAEQSSEDAIYAEEMAKALVDSAKAAWETKRAQLNAGQSLSSTIREELRLARG